MKAFYPELIQKEFPILKRMRDKQQLVYLDSAATTLKPKTVIDRISHYYLMETANVHRGAHLLSDEATEMFEKARKRVAQFLKAREVEEIVFVRGTTEAINLVASSYGEKFLNEGDEILLTDMEHHANIVPWQILAEKKKLKMQHVAVLDSGELDLKDFRQKLSSRTKVFAFTACSNTLGTVNPIELLCAEAQKFGARVLVDAAQMVTHGEMDVEKWGADFVAFSSHKIFGPTGFGILYGKKDLLNEMPPYQGGGSMIDQVSWEGTTFLSAPFRFEAGTPHIEGAIGCAAALDFFHQFPISEVRAHKKNLLQAATEKVKSIPGIRIYGEAKEKTSILSFGLEGTHPSDVGQILDQQGVAVRTGHHCTLPLMNRFKIPGTVRASFSIYNSEADVDRLYQGILKAKEMLL